MQTGQSFTTGCPIAASGVESLARRLDTTDDGVTKMERFESTIFWVTESESQLVLRNEIGDDALRQSDQNNDFYGLVSSPSGSFEGVPRAVRSFGLAHDSFLRLDLVVKVTDTPVMDEGEDSGIKGRRIYRACPGDWMYADLADAWFAAADRSQAASPYLARRQTFAGVVWTSRWLDAEADEQASRFSAAMQPVLIGLNGSASRKAQWGMDRSIEGLKKALSEVRRQARAG
ncbi:MAG TPA: hypothetical protein VL418_17210 [Devosiaceae bacterium]|nr:hypothetical protein [Devosiaceae bacterium]